MGTQTFLFSDPNRSVDPQIPAAARLDDGRVVLAYRSATDTATFTLLEEDGISPTAVPETISLLNASDTSIAVAALGGGGFVLVYEGADADFNDGLIGALFDSNGFSFTAPVFVELPNSIRDSRIAVTGLADGGWVFAATGGSTLGGPDPTSAILQRYDALGTRVDGGTGLSDITGDGKVELAALTSGGWVAAYVTESGTAEFRVFGADGSDRGATRADSAEGSVEIGSTVDVVGLDGGGFAVSWLETRGGTSEIVVRTYSNAGNPTGAEIVANPSVNADSGPDLAAMAGGGFTVGWRNADPDEPVGFVYSRYSADGTLLTEEGSALGSKDSRSDAFELVGLEGGGFSSYASLPNLNTGLSFNASLIAGSVREQVTEQADFITLAPEVQLNALGGNDVITGTNGNDTVDGGSGDDRLLGRGGSDLLHGAEGSDTLVGGRGNDLLRGGADDDTLSGDGGRDVLRGFTGADDLRGGDGDDVLRGGSSNDALDGGDGSDFLSGGADDDLLQGAAGDDVLRGGVGDDTLEGGRDADTLIGGDGDDLGDGGRWRDRIDLGDGDDIYIGGDGPDRFVFRGQTSGNDEILDYDDQRDTIELIGTSAGRFADLQIQALGSNALIEFGEASILVLGAAGQLDASDFDFG